jgi:hypothetical protein
MLASLMTVVTTFGAILLLMVALVAYGWQQICELVIYIIGIIGDTIILPFL